MKITVSGNIQTSTIKDLQTELEPLVGKIEFRHVEFRSLVSPSIIEILISAIEWLPVFKVAATVFLSQLVKEAATDLYKNKAKIAIILKDTAIKPIKILTDIIVKAVKNRTKVSIGLPIPDDHFGVAILIESSDEEFVAWVLSSYISQLDLIESAVNEIAKSDKSPTGRIQLIIQPDGGFILKWMDKNQLEIHELKI